MYDEKDFEKWVIDTKSDRVLKFSEFIQKRGHSPSNFSIKKYSTKSEAERKLRDIQADSFEKLLIELEDAAIEDQNILGREESPNYLDHS